MNGIHITCYPDAAQYTEEEPVSIVLRTNGTVLQDKEVLLTVNNLERRVCSKHVLIRGENGCTEIKIPLGCLPGGGYGVDIFCEENAVLHTAFDVTPCDGVKIIRYGFLTDFGTEETDDEDICFANRMHLNALQFYDWMYRHDCLVGQKAVYENPLSIEISNDVLKRKIALCKKYHIRPFAYGAVYAASKEFYKAHKEWAMYTKDGNVMTFADWLVFMNIHPDCGWNEYIIKQFQNAVMVLGFQGIHMDTYGYPKKAWSSTGDKLDLENDFPELINRSATEVRKADPKAGVIFNAVNDWPVEKVALSHQDSIYIEVWPPHDTYYDLYQLIKKARRLSLGRQVILAAYMHPFAKENGTPGAEKAFLLTYAAIHASGGFQLVLGEHNGILCDSYYNKYAVLEEEFIPMVAFYADYVVRYQELLSDWKISDISMTATGGINEDICFSSQSAGFSTKAEAGKIWTIAGITENRLILNMINLCGESDLWNESKKSGKINIRDIHIRMLLDREIKGVYWASPDTDGGMMRELTYESEIGVQGNMICLSNISLTVWSTVWVDFC